MSRGTAETKAGFCQRGHRGGEVDKAGALGG